MTDTIEASGRSDLSRTGQPLLGPIRLTIGALQGLALWALERSADSEPSGHSAARDLAWPATVPELYLPLILIAAFVPVLLLAGIGRMRPLTLAVWIAVATALLALMGWHEVARQSADTLYGPPFLNGPMPVFAAAALFIGHHLILPADMERRWIAAFPTYFDTAWKAAVQLALSLAFTGVFWVLLFLGAGLFRVIGLDFLEALTRQSWFIIPVTTFVFSVAVHLTDVRDGLIRGVRAVGLMLLSWLLLVITVLTAGFVVALPFTGLKGLWDTGSASTLILAAVAALIILINAAYQDGREENRPPLPLRLAVQVAALLLVPLVVIAFWALLLRIGQHGLTPDRIIALACAVVGAVFAGGYAWASVRTLLKKSEWMRPLEPTTLAGGALAFVLIVALFSPVADPARLSVADQVARLERGAVAPDQFDYRFLRFGSGKAGQAALDRLTRSANADVARRARQTTTASNRHEVLVQAPRPTTDIRIDVLPAGAALPPTFIQQYGRLRELLDECTIQSPCKARLHDLDRDGTAEVLVANASGIRLIKREADGRWFEWARYTQPSCRTRANLAADFASSGFETAPPVFPDLIVGGVRLRHEEGAPECATDTEAD
jgi:hypothetical protein